MAKKATKAKRKTTAQIAASKRNLVKARAAAKKVKKPKDTGGWTPEKIAKAKAAIAANKRAVMKRQMDQSSTWMPGSSGYGKRGLKW